jgi:hypothetical protein
MLANFTRKGRRLFAVVAMAFAVLALNVGTAFAQETSPVGELMDAAVAEGTAAVPLIVGGLVTVIVLGLGITLLWVGRANAKKGVNSLKG